MHDRNRDERHGDRRVLRLPEPDAEFCRLDLDRRVVVRRAHGARGGRDPCGAVRRMRRGLRLDGGVVALCDRHGRRWRRRRRRSVRPVRDSVRADHGRRLCDDRAAAYARLRDDVGAAGGNCGDDAPACVDESGGEVPRSDHGRRRARVANHLVAAASARLLHHQRRRRRAGNHVGGARARPEEEAGLYSRHGRDGAPRGARAARLFWKSRRRNRDGSRSSARASRTKISTWR